MSSITNFNASVLTGPNNPTVPDDYKGTVRHDGQNVYRGMENQYDQAKAKLDDLQQQRESVENDPHLSPAEKQALLAELDIAEQALNEALDYTTLGGKYDTNLGSTAGDNDLAAVLASMGRAEAAMRAVGQELNAAAAHGHCQVTPPPCQGPARAHASDGAQGGGGVSGASGADEGASAGGESGVGAMEFGGKTVNQMVEMMDGDPNALMGHLDSLGEEDRQMAMQMLNQRLQQMNQMFSMMSNMAKSLHDTAKAAINNMRV